MLRLSTGPQGCSSLLPMRRRSWRRNQKHMPSHVMSLQAAWRTAAVRQALQRIKRRRPSPQPQNQTGAGFVQPKHTCRSFR